MKPLLPALAIAMMAISPAFAAATSMAVAVSMMEGWTGIDIDGDGKADSKHELPQYDPGATHAQQMPGCVL